MHFEHYALMGDTELDGVLFGLTIECPLGRHSTQCPLDPLRKLSLRERFTAISQMSRAEKEALMALHVTLD
ncbi:MAG TPA: hypothetical protein VIX81_06585 [Gammaproteobacteria bacterium]